jgi:hypothetical protein
MEQMSQEQAAVYARNLQGIVKAIEPDVVLQRMDVEWKDRVSSLSGVELEPGETILRESTWPLTNGEALRYYTAIRFEGMERLDGKPVAKLVYRFDTDPQALSEFAGKAFDNPGAIAEAGAEVRGEGERLIDPETLLIQAETRTRTIVAELPQSDGATAKITRHEVIEYRYDYPDAVPGEEPTGE